MNPVQPAQRLERPPQPAVVPADIDSAEDEETDTSTAESSMPSAQFRVLPWHISDSLQSGGYSPATLTRGFSPSSSGQPTLTPESSLTVWSGANVMHYGGKVLGGHDSAAAYAAISAEHGSGLLNATTTSGNGNGASGANWTSASRDMATFDLLRANSGRAGGGSSTAPRLRRNSNPQNAGLTEENLDFLRRVPSARKTSARAAAGPPSARPPRPHPAAAGVAPAAQPERSAESPPRHSVKAAVAAFNKRWATDSPKRERRERRLVSPVRLDSRAGATAAIAATTEAEDDALGKVASRRRRTVTPLTADAARTQPPLSEPQNGHDEAPTGKQSDSVQPGTGQHSSPIDHSTPQSSAIPTNTTTTAAAPSTTAAASPDEIPTVVAPSQRRPPLPPLLADLHAAAQPPSPCASSSSPSTATTSSSVSPSGRASRGPAGSVDGRRRRTPSRHQAQVLFDDAAATPPQPPATVVAAADTAGEPVSPALVASSPPSGDAAAAATATPATAPPALPSTGNGAATRRRAASTGRKPTTVIAAAPGDSIPPAGGNSSGGGGAAAAAGAGAAVTSPPAPSSSTPGQTVPPTGPASTPPRTMEVSPLKLTGAKRAPAAGAAGKSGGVPAPPSRYTSAGRLVQAARRRTVTSPLDAGLPKPSSTAPAPKPTTRSGSRSGGAKANAVQPTGSTSPPSDRPISAKSSAVAAAHRMEAPEAQENGQAAVAVAAAAPGTVNADRDVSDMNSLVSCSVHTIPPEKVQPARAAEESPQPQPQQSSLVEPTASAGSGWQQTASLQPAALGAAADARASDGAPADALNVTTPHPTRVAGGGEQASPPQQWSVKETDGLDAAPLTPPRVTKDAPPLESVSPASRTVRSNPPLSPSSGAAIPDPFGRHAPVVQLGREGLSPSPTKSWEAPRKVPPLPPADRTRSASPKGSDDSLTGPPSPTRSSRVGASRRGLAGASSGTLGGPSRRSFTTMGGRSSANVSREWTLNGSIECPLSVTSTQAPLSVRLPNSSLHWPHSGPQTLNTRSSSADTSDRGERDMSFGSSLSTSADPSTAEAAASVTHTMLAATLCVPLVPFAAAHASTSAAVVGAAQHACPPPPPPPSVACEPSAATAHEDGPLSQSPGHPNQQGGAEAEEEKQSAEHNHPTATEADALPAALAPPQPLSQPQQQQQQQLRALLIESAAPAAAVTSPRLLVSPPTSTPPTAALRARRATLTVQGSMERLDLTERRPSAPLPVDRRGVGSAATAKSATVSPALRPMRRSIEKAVNSPGLTSPVLKAASPVPAGAAGAAAAPTLMTVGGRQLPRMFPAADTTPPLSASAAPERAAAATAAPTKDKREKTKRQQPHAQDGSAARNGGDGNDPTTASANSDAGDGTDRGSRGAPQSPSGRRRARSVPANMLARERQGGSATTPPLGVSPPPEFDGGLSLNTGTEAASRPRGEPPHRLHSNLHGAPNRSPGGPRVAAAADGDGAGGSGGPTRAVRGSAAQLLPPTLHTASGGHLPSVSSPAEATDGAFQPSPLRLPALPRFARVPLVAPAADSPPCPPSDATGRAMTTIDDVRHDSSGSGNLKDSNTAASGARPATGSKSADEKPARLCDGNTSSIHSRADATQGEGSVNGETHEVPQAKRPANRTPRARQRAPSVYFCD